ncbi:MAG: hypothetical protein JWL90_2048 [Chthoniobacteraceae bacterium]|nr:hypothetical protein [Chthoniobacteraceae bacterium]
MNAGTVAIMPPGALGVSFFYHLTGGLERLDRSVFFIGLDESRSIDSLLAGDLRIASGSTLHALPAREFIYRSLNEVFEAGALPEVLIVCPNPDQLLPVISTLVALIERLCASNGEACQQLELPTIVLSSNGIYFQRVRQMFIEKLEESTLLGRLPDLWPDQMPYIIGHFLRGVTIQTGLREGSGSNAIYRPGPRGISLLVGGGEAVRRRCFELLSGLGGWFELASNVSPTRLEFEKAIVNLTVNFLGLLYAFDFEEGFRPLTIAEILTPEHEPAVRELAYRVFEIGRAVKAFTQVDDFEKVLGDALARCRPISSHIPSSLQTIDLQIKLDRLEVKFTPTETWLVDPLIRYARSSNLPEAADYFEGLRAMLMAKLEKAVARQALNRPKA